VQKAGHATVTDVLHYGERVRARGLTLLEAPGNDAVSSTALAAAGATAILFTTGRGTPLGFPGADDQDRLEQRSRRSASRAGSISTRARR
jgi:altronate dehydratase